MINPPVSHAHAPIVHCYFYIKFVIMQYDSVIDVTRRANANLDQIDWICTAKRSLYCDCQVKAIRLQPIYVYHRKPRRGERLAEERRKGHARWNETVTELLASQSLHGRDYRSDLPHWWADWPLSTRTAARHRPPTDAATVSAVGRNSRWHLTPAGDDAT